MKRKSHLILTRGHNSPKWYFKINFYVWKRVNGLKKLKSRKLVTILDTKEARHEAKSTPTQNHVTYKACTVNLLPIVGPNPQSIFHRISVFLKNCAKIVKIRLEKWQKIISSFGLKIQENFKNYKNFTFGLGKCLGKINFNRK